MIQRGCRVRTIQDTRNGLKPLYGLLKRTNDIVTKDELDKTVDELEQEVIHELNLDFSPDENPNKMFSVIFPYQIRFTIPSDAHNTEIVINTKTEEFYSGRNQQDVLFQKEHSNRYSKTAFIKHIQNYVRDELWRVNPEDAHLTYTGKPEVREMSESELSTFEREIAEND